MNKHIYLFLISLLALAGCDKLETSLATLTAPTPEAQEQATNLTEQGYELITKKQYKPAIILFDQALEHNNRNVRAYQGKGIALNELGKHGEAEAMYDKALAIDPKALGVINNLAMSYILRNEYQNAIDLLQTHASDFANQPKMLENLALANCLLGKREDARKLYSARLSPPQVEENLKFCTTYETMRKNAPHKKAKAQPEKRNFAQ